MIFSNISVVGLGYIGLPTAAVIASRGINVTGVDINPETVDTVNEGKVHIVEPDLDIIVKSVVAVGKLTASRQAKESDAFLVTVPTPLDNKLNADLSFIQSAVELIAPTLRPGNLVILESTSPVGATEQMAKWLAEARPDLIFPQQDPINPDVNVAHCPERVLPGHVIRELVENDRVIGGMSPGCSEKAVALYKTFVKGECLITNARTAEMAKLTENSFRDVNIAFANELSLICDKLSINVWELIKLANRHPRVNILNPGPGVGGHCIAVDPWFIVSSAPEESKLIKQARLVNDAKPSYVLNKILAEADEFKRPVVACFGLAFKADIDDLRESPALDITLSLAKQSNFEVLVVEPNIDALPLEFEGSNAKLVSLEQAFEQAKVMAVLVDHTEFRAVRTEMWANKVVIDSRGIV